ncbi:MAG: hypothetical protein U0W65_12215 [Bacteroidia bacterium]
MRKLYFLFITFLSISLFAQKDYSRYYNSWRLGLNLGGAWQTADYRSCWGMAGGLTLEKGFHENSTNIFSFAIRGRYLAANTYGMDYHRNYYVNSNPAYNGTYNPTVNYLTDTTRKARGYVYDNYKMQLGEGSLELQLSFNRLRERTHVILNLWGGVGITSFRTKSDLLDADGKIYDFNMVDSTGNKTNTINTYNALIDKKYETYAYGSKNGNLITFSPSGGIGLGYQFSPGFSMLWEYKITFPQGANADLLDGKLAFNNDAIGRSNDYYHYTGLNLLFTLRGKKKTHTTTNNTETVYTNTTTTATNSVSTTTSITPTATVSTTTPTVVTTNPTTTLPPAVPKPVISFITPPTNGFVVNNQVYKISAQILNVSGAGQIQFKFNGVPHSDFTFNNQTHILEYNSNLNVGSNAVQIIASNQAGTDNKSTTVVYELPKPTGNPPVVSFINPPVAGSSVSTPNYQVKAQVLNVAGQNEISVYLNGMSTAFNYNANTKQVSFNANLNQGLNTISITGNNALGEDTKTTDITYIVPKVSGVPPVISLINPASNNSSTTNSIFNFKLSVLNVTSKNDIVLNFNGQNNSVFNYDLNTKTLDFSSNLNLGSNTLIVSASNAFGTDTKTISVTYTAPIKVKLPPVVTISNPAVSPGVTNVPNYIFKATATNVTSKSQLVVKVNGIVNTNYTFANSMIVCPSILISGNNIFEVTATNNDGTDFKTGIVNFKPKNVGIPPVVSLINPPSQINATDNQLYNFKLSVLNVNSQSDIELLFNGAPQTSFTYDVNTKEVFFQTNLVVGNNTVLVKGTNAYGTDSKTINVEYTPHADIKLPPVVTITNPVTSPTSSSALNYVFRATVTNITSKSQLVVKVNGVVNTGFVFTNSTVICPSTLVTGSNVFEVTATNNDGTDMKTGIVTYRPKVAGVPPVVSLINPPSQINATDNQLYNFKLSVLNVNSQSDIELLFNGAPQTNFTYDVNTKEVFFQTNLVVGSNTVAVKGTNAFGVDSKTINVEYTPHADIKLPPVITFVSPATSVSSSQDVNYIFKATISNMPNTNGLDVKFNGNQISNYTYDGFNLSYTGNLNTGANVLSISATNNDGSDAKSVTVNHRPKVLATPPVVNIINPKDTPVVTNASYNFQFKTLYVTQNQISVSLNGKPVNRFNFVANTGSFTANLDSVFNTLVVNATNNYGSVTKSEMVIYKQLPIINESDTSRAANIPNNGNGSKTMVICHYGANSAPQTVQISPSQWYLHEGHGDTKGECPAPKNSNQIKVTPRSTTPIQIENNKQPTDTLNKQPINTPRRPR